MLDLRKSLEALPNVEVLRFAWIDGAGTDHSVSNVYQHDMAHVLNCHLFVGVLDIFSGGLGMELQTRCEKRMPLRVFFPKGQTLSRMIPDCIEYHWKCFNLSDSGVPPYLEVMPMPIEYTHDVEIVRVVADWTQARLRKMQSA